MNILYHTILFDLDGTLVNNTKSILESYKSAYFELRRTNWLLIEYPGDEFLHKLMGRSIDYIREKLILPNYLAIEFENLYKKYLFEYEVELIEGMRELLVDLSEKNIPLAIVTSKIKETTDDLLDKLKIRSYFREIITANDCTNLKPDPEPLLKACERLAVLPSSKIVYIGDTKNDMIAALNAGIDAIGVSWGISGEEICLLDNIKCVNKIENLRSLIS